MKDYFKDSFDQDPKIVLKNEVTITPSQKDPKQQELRIHLRPRLDLGPCEGFC